jgi:hypothetical protein
MKLGGVRVGEGIREINMMKNGKKDVDGGVKFDKGRLVQDAIYWVDQGFPWFPPGPDLGSR